MKHCEIKKKPTIIEFCKYIKTNTNGWHAPLKKKKGNCYLQQLTFYDNFRDSVKVAVLINAKCTIARMIGNFLEGFNANLVLPSILRTHLYLWFHLQKLLHRKSRSIDCIYSLLTKLNLSCTLLTKIKTKISIKLKLIYPFILILTILLWKKWRTLFGFI